MHADCTGVIDANPIFAMAEAVGAESGGDNDDQEELDDMVFHLLHCTALTALNLACFTPSLIFSKKNSDFTIFTCVLKVRCFCAFASNSVRAPVFTTHLRSTAATVLLSALLCAVEKLQALLNLRGHAQVDLRGLQDGQGRH